MNKSISFYLFFLIYSSGVLIAKGHDCEQSVPMCEDFSIYEKESSNPYMEIKFPFRLRKFQVEECGYPGFDLACTIDNQTVVHLPKFPHKLYVQDINYYNQRIMVKPSESYFHSRESRRSLELLNLSTTPFRFTSKFSLLARLNCSRSTFRDVELSSLVEDNSHLSHCTKMYSFNAPADLDQIEDYYLSSESFWLKWSLLSCKICTLKGKGCRRKNNAAQIKTECFDWVQNEDVASISGPIKAIVKAVSTVGSFLILGVAASMLYVYRRDKEEEEHQRRIEKFLEDYTALKPSRYSYIDIKKITDNFKIKLGEGAYGIVFRGKLSSDVLVAVKILAIPFKNAGNGEDFVNEVATMGRIHHVNVVRLVGFCADGYRRALVYEFLPNHSLDKYISRNQSSLTWVQFNGIAIGIAKGIDYLHQGCDQRILHFDIKPHNILLDQNFTPKICDFGLAKLCSKDQSLVSMTATRGTMGYIAPEVFSRNFGKVSCKSDVYSFGMLLLEMVAGRKNTASSEDGAEEIYYPEWIYNLLEEGEDLRIQVEEEGDDEIAKRLAIIGLWCIQWHPAGRPTMKHVVQMLEGKGGDLKMPPNPFSSMSGPTMQRMAFELEPIME